MKRAFLIAGLLLTSNYAGASYGYYRTITVNAAQVSTQAATYTDFPVLISTFNIALTTTTAQGGRLNSTGFDLVFSTKDNTCSYLLKWDTETVSNVGVSTMSVWVKVPTISSTTDTTLYMCYGDAGVTTYQGISTATWSNKYGGVWHFDETLTGAGQTVYDSVGINNGTSVGTWSSGKQVTGQIRGALSFTDTDDSISIPDSPTTSPTTAFTYSFWMNPNGTTISLASWIGHGAFNDGMSMGHYYTYPMSVWVGDLATFGQYATYADPRGTAWHYFVVTFDGSQTSTNRLQIYMDAVAGTNVGGYYPPAAITDPTAATIIGGGNSDTSGIMDEIRISSGIARSADWIKTEYNNQSSPTTFTSIGSETTSGTAAASNAFFFGEF